MLASVRGVVSVARRALSSSSVVAAAAAPSVRWADVAKGPEDAILGLNIAFRNDASPNKVNLGVGAYRDNNGKPWVLPCVREAEKRIFDTGLDMEYAPIAGSDGFTKSAAELLFGSECVPLKERRVASVQAISGTGALRVGFDFCRRFMGPDTVVYVPSPTWGNHKAIIKDAGMQVKDYRYFSPALNGLDFDAMLTDIKNAPKQSFFMFHACAHNPTGTDPTPAQWAAINEVCRDRDHFVFFDSAYQGFASGDTNRDAQPLRDFIASGHNVIAAQSFAKNFGLYGHRVGALHVVGATRDITEAVLSQLKILIRPMYSNPPIHGARIVETVLSDKALRAQWFADVRTMADRIIGMRTELVNNLKKAGSTRNWSHVTSQIGMFCFTGLTPDQVDVMKTEHHIYMTRDGRISMAGLTSKNVEYVAKAIHAVTK